MLEAAAAAAAAARQEASNGVLHLLLGFAARKVC